MTSGNIFPQRFTEIDDLTRPDHAYLAAVDECYFLGEYTARRGFAFSKTNSLVLNLKKSLDRRGRPEWVHKGRAIQAAAVALRAAFNSDAHAMLTFVPVPPSKARNDPLYDDRLVRVLQLIWPNQSADIRELVIQPTSTAAVHDHETRPAPAELQLRYVLDHSLRHPEPQIVAIFDDVLTTGAHFVAVRSVLREIYPATKLVGLFIARRVPESMDIEDFEDLSN